MLIGTVPNNENLRRHYCICPKCGAMFHRWQHMRSFNIDTLKKLFSEIGFQKGTFFQPDFSPTCLGFIVMR